jgi:hypothetical protein
MANEDRTERLKAALRENLKRRKAQARGRDTARETADEDTNRESKLAANRPTD